MLDLDRSKLIRDFGGARRVSLACGINKSCVYKWVHTGNPPELYDAIIQCHTLITREERCDLLHELDMSLLSMFTVREIATICGVHIDRAELWRECGFSPPIVVRRVQLYIACPDLPIWAEYHKITEVSANSCINKRLGADLER